MIYIIYFILCCGVTYLADSWKRSGFGWFLLSLFLSPIIAGAFLLLAGNATPKKKCPKCAEQVLAEATVCKHCHHNFPAQPEVAVIDNVLEV